MDHETYSVALDFAAGALLLTAVLIVWHRDLARMVRLVALQGVALAAIPLVGGVHESDPTLVPVAAAVLVLRAVILPWLLGRAVAAEPGGRRESTPLVNTASSLLAVSVLTVTAFAVTGPIVDLERTAGTTAVSAAFAVVFVALFVMATRRRAVSQAIGFLMLDNGIAAAAFLLTAGVPLIVELGASLDVLFAIVVIGVLTGRLHTTFGDTDLDQLRELRD